jgi:hypothetical protein
MPAVHMTSHSIRIHKNALKCTHTGERTHAYMHVAYIGYSLKISHNCFASTFQFIIHNHGTIPCYTTYAAIKITLKTKKHWTFIRKSQIQMSQRMNVRLEIMSALSSTICYHHTETPHSMHWLVRLSFSGIRQQYKMQSMLLTSPCNFQQMGARWMILLPPLWVTHFSIINI